MVERRVFCGESSAIVEWVLLSRISEFYSGSKIKSAQR